MDTSLKTNKTEHLTPVWRGGAVRELTEEYVVPDSMPDLGLLLLSDGVLTMQGKDTEPGVVRLTASLSVSVVYVPEGGGTPRSLSLSLPADMRIEAPEADTDARTTSRLRVRALEVRTLNSRKVAIHAELEADVCCYRSDTLCLADGMAEEESGAHIRRETAGSMLVSDVREKTFAVTDEYAPPAGSGADGVLSRRVELISEDVRFVGGKVLFRGRVKSELLFSEAETGRISVGRYETEFSQIMEIDAAGEDAQPELSLFLTGAYFDLPDYTTSQGKIQAEFHMGAQCVCRERREMSYMSDVYSNRTELVPQKESVPLVRSVRPVVMRQTVADRIDAAGREGELVYACASVGDVSAEDRAVRTSVELRLVSALPGGEYAAARGRLSAEFTLPDLSDGERLRDAVISVTDIYCVPGTGDVRVSLRLDAVAEEEAPITCVRSVEEDEEALQNRGRTPSAVMLRVPSGTDLWSLARQYHSAVEDILLVNEGRSDGLLLIPKGR